MSGARATSVTETMDDKKPQGKRKSKSGKKVDRENVSDKQRKSSKPMSVGIDKKYIPSSSVSKAKKVMETFTFSITTRKPKSKRKESSEKPNESINGLHETAIQKVTASPSRPTNGQISDSATISELVVRKDSQCRESTSQALEKGEDETIPTCALEDNKQACLQTTHKESIHSCHNHNVVYTEEDPLEHPVIVPPECCCINTCSQFSYPCFLSPCNYPVRSDYHTSEQGVNEELHCLQYDCDYEYNLIHNFRGQCTTTVHTHTFCDIMIDTEPTQTRTPDITIDHNGKCIINSSCLMSTDGQNYNIRGFDVKFFKSQVTPENTGSSIRLDFHTDGFIEPNSFEAEVDEHGNICVSGIIFAMFSDPSKLWIAAPAWDPDLVTIENPSPYYYTIEVPY